MYVPDPQFEGQTKDKLGNREVEGHGRISTVGELFSRATSRRTRTVAKTIVQQGAAGHARRARRPARPATWCGASRRWPAATCRRSSPTARARTSDEAELFLVEGDSAGGSAKEGRDRQASRPMLPLKGKILNVEKARLDKMLGHSEIQTIISALGCGIADDFDIEKVRYGKTIIMTDADVDGSHIRTLLLTFFFRHMRPLIDHGMLYIAQPPLYKLKTKSEETYIGSEAELRRELVRLGVRSITIRDLESDRTWSGAELEEVLDALRRVEEAADNIAPAWTRLTPAAVIEAFDGAQVPIAWARVGERDHFFMSQREKADFLELQRVGLPAGEELKVFDGPESNVPRDDAQVLTSRLLHTDELQQALLDLEAKGIRARNGRFQVERGKTANECESVLELAQVVRKSAEGEIELQRYKGLGEMNPEQLWESTMDPERRRLYQVQLDDEFVADEIFTILMSPGVEPRRDYIEKYALEVTNLDV